MAGTSEEWVQIIQAGRASYFWNRRTQETTDNRMPAEWSAQHDPASGNLYYWRTGSSQPPVWQLPELEVVTPSQPSQQRHPSQTQQSELDISTPESAKTFQADGESPPFAEVGVDDACLASDSWVRVQAGPPYYWNFVLGTSVEELPQDLSVRWEAYQSYNDWYYVDVESQKVMWELPCRHLQPVDASEIGLEIGMAVQLVNLAKQPRFNNQSGVLIDAMPGRCLVRLCPEITNLVLAVSPKKLQPLSPGVIVEIHSLSKEDLNGIAATVQSYQPQNRRYTIKLPNGEDKSVKSTNLKPRSPLWNLHEHLVPGKASTSLQWRNELNGLFVDKTGQHRSYMLHLPPGFNLKEPDEDRRWPLLVYLHGTGGGSFFTHSKKSLKTEAMQNAATCFVVVSPRCDWTWRDVPKSWVVELTRALSALEWIDNERIYLTGVSMGGMGAWEVGAQAPDLFAAVCPVAAHHKPERSAFIASQLRCTPLYVVHDDTDDTCPIATEEPLWRLLEDNGHGEYFRKVISHNVDHCKIFEQAYCNEEDLFGWLTQWTIGAMSKARGNRVRRECSSGGG